MSRLWSECAAAIDKMMERVADFEDFSVLPHTSLAADDLASSPYQVSHAVRHCIVVGTDNLHAVKQLVVEDQVLHVTAPFTLARASLEVLAVGYWILGPAKRSVRVEHTLRWNAKNFRDQHSATDQIPTFEQNSTLEEKLDKLQRVAERRNIGRQFRGGYYSTTAVKYAETHSESRVLLPWQMCSGYAHGRPWASLGTSDREEFSTDDPEVANLKMTSSLSMTLYPVRAAVHLLADLVKLHKQRAESQY